MVKGLLQDGFTEAVASIRADWPSRLSGVNAGDIAAGPAIPHYDLDPQLLSAGCVWRAIDKDPWEYLVPILVDGRPEFEFGFDVSQRAFEGVSDSAFQWVAEKRAMDAVGEEVGPGGDVRVIVGPWSTALGRTLGGGYVVTFFNVVHGGGFIQTVEPNLIYKGTEAARLFRASFASAP